VTGGEPTDAKAALLGRIRAALAGAPGEVAVPRAYHQTSGAARERLVHDFVERASDYRAAVYRVGEAGLRDRVAAVCAERSAARLAVPSDLPDAWLSEGVTWVRDAGLAHRELADLDGVLTGCALAVAQTGTVVLDGGAYQGRRALTLLPDLHLCVVFEHHIVGTVPEAVAALAEAARARRPLTFISGPSATSDIELSRVEGVHGPRNLVILLVRSTL
jgi:L-lactate dehydrogenase complex protein LldG